MKLLFYSSYYKHSVVLNLGEKNVLFFRERRVSEGNLLNKMCIHLVTFMTYDVCD